MITEGAKTVVRFHDPESRLEFAHPWPQPVIDGEKGNSSFCLVNALELLDQPGEWYQDYPSGRIYYYPRPHEDMTKAQVIIPALETLLTVNGTLERPVRNIHFQNICRYRFGIGNNIRKQCNSTALATLDCFDL